MGPWTSQDGHRRISKALADMRLVSLASLLVRVVPLVTAEAEVGIRSCVYDAVLRALRLEQDQSIPFCRDFMTTVIIVSVTVTITDSTTVTETIRPTYTDLSTKTETATVSSSPPDNNALLKRILAARDEIADYSSSLVSRYSSSALSSACSCLCIDPIGFASTATTTTQTIPETTVDTSTEFETVEGPTSTVHATTTTTTTVAVPPPIFPSEYFTLAFFVGDEVEYERNWLAFPTSGPRQNVFQSVNSLDYGMALCRFDTDHHLSGIIDGPEGRPLDNFAWYPGGVLDQSSPYEVPFDPPESISPPLEYLEWTADPRTYNLILLTDESFNVMQLCPSVDSGLSLWAVGAVLGSGCTEIPLVVEPWVDADYPFLIYYRDSEGTKQYLTRPESLGTTETAPYNLISGPKSDQSLYFAISYNHLSFSVIDNLSYLQVYSYFLDEVFQQGGDGWMPVFSNTPSYVKFFHGDGASFLDWVVDWEAYTIRPVIPGLDALMVQMCTVGGSISPILAIGTTLRNDASYTCTAVILELEIFPARAPSEDFRIFTLTDQAEELYLYRAYDLQPGDEQSHFTLVPKELVLTLAQYQPLGFFSIDVAGHLSFYSSELSTPIYAWSADYPEPAGWRAYIGFSPATDIEDPSFYLQFSTYVSTFVTSIASDRYDLFLGMCPDEYMEGKYIDLWSADTSEILSASCTYPPFNIRPKTWPFRLSWIDSQGHKQYFNTSFDSTNPESKDDLEPPLGLILIPTSNVTESPIFTIDADRRLWYYLDLADGPVRLFSTIYHQEVLSQGYPIRLFFSSAEYIDQHTLYLEWDIDIENRVLFPAAAPASKVWQVCPDRFKGPPPAAAVWTSVFEDADNADLSCYGIELNVEWQLESVLYP
ncbi:hypothetical protein V8F20_007172 [Naviculisporaceae sp. PSN 640]